MPRRILSAVLLCALAFVPACVSSSTSPGQLDPDRVKAALDVYDFYRARAGVFAAVAFGPKPTQSAVDDYNRALFFLDSARQTLVLFGAPPAEETPPYVQLVGGRVVPVK